MFLIVLPVNTFPYPKPYPPQFSRSLQVIPWWSNTKDENEIPFCIKKYWGERRNWRQADGRHKTEVKSGVTAKLWLWWWRLPQEKQQQQQQKRENNNITNTKHAVWTSIEIHTHQFHFLQQKGHPSCWCASLPSFYIEAASPTMLMMRRRWKDTKKKNFIPLTSGISIHHSCFGVLFLLVWSATATTLSKATSKKWQSTGHYNGTDDISSFPHENSRNAKLW